MAKASYSDKQKRDALALYAEHGPAEASRRCSISASTIRKWAQRAGVTGPRAKKVREATNAAAASAAQKREELKPALAQLARDLIDRCYEPHVEFVGKDGRREQIATPTPGGCRDYATAAAIAIDKLELLEGRATGRFDGRLDVRSQLDREIEELMGQVKANDNGNRVTA